MIGIIDYGMGNLRSVQKAFERLGVAARVCPKPDNLEGCDKWVLPGVGAFRDAIAELRKQGFVEPVREHLRADRPLLGICLGMQLLMDVSYEDGRWEGLGAVAGDVLRFPDQADLKVPHMGWNSIATTNGTALLNDIPQGGYFYFVHSYYVAPRDSSVVAARTEYGLPFTSVIHRGRMFATQFHPEKSQKLGLQLLKNFAAM